MTNFMHNSTVRSMVFASVMLALAAPARAQTACDADTNGDGTVDSADLGLLLSAWGPCAACAADVNDDGQVDSADLGALLSFWGETCSALPWATVLEEAPDPAIVTDVKLRKAIVATGYPWRVRDNLTQIEMVLIPPGSFNMGCSSSNATACLTNENPVHPVTFTAGFYMGRYEVTQAQWTARMGANPSFYESASPEVPAAQVPNRPVERVSWEMIQRFLSDTGMRLPTEAEWEYAYRAGTTTAFHGWPANPEGTNIDEQLRFIAWYSPEAASQTRPVGGKAPNGFGLHDMSGNVSEWVYDWYSPSYYASSPATSPPGPAGGTGRMLRGGSGLGSDTGFLRSSRRNSMHPHGSGFQTFGFRVVRSLADTAAIVSAVEPSSGPPIGGTTVTITGTNLANTTSILVDGIPAGGVTVVSPTQVTAIVPQAASVGAKDLIVTSAEGVRLVTGAFTYIVPNSISPASGPTTGGTMVTITAANLAGTAGVTIGGVPATAVTVVNPTTVTAVTPAGASGSRDVSVTTGTGELLLGGAFQYAAVPTPTWATLLEPLPDPAIVTSASLRQAIIATGLPWRVRDNITQIEMVLIPPGSFAMGCSASTWTACNAGENPVHAVTLTNAFYLGRYEVTQAQWDARMGTNPSYFQFASAVVPSEQVPNRPVERVSWNMIQGYLPATGLRLPTEAEWEYAYRAGTTTAFHGWSTQPDGAKADDVAPIVAWVASNSAEQTRPVGGKAPNGFGLHDMAGNVQEWVDDWYSSTYYASSPTTNPPGPLSGSRRVIRGGYWDILPVLSRASTRGGYEPNVPVGWVGFRVARTP
jgi:formylglycine-generating enzyme required for sulfatase activity